MDDNSVETKIKNELTWLQKHEKLILVPLVGLVLWFGIGKIDTLVANHDAAKLTEAQATALIQEHRNEAIAYAAQQAAAEYKALAEKVTAQNASLEAANITLATALTRQQKTDAALPPSELIVRWAQLVPHAEVSILADGHIAVPQSTAVATVQELEKVPVLTEQLSNAETSLTNDEQLLIAGKGLNDTLYAQVDGLKLQIVDDSKVCKAQVASVKAEARKGKRKWFLIGYVAGFVSRQAIKSYLGF